MKENENALKHILNNELLNEFASYLDQIKIPKKDVEEFKKLKTQLTPLELKDRINLIANSLWRILQDTKKIEPFLDKVLNSQNINGLQWWPVSNLIEEIGKIHPEIALNYMEKLTVVFTSEFAVRHLLNTQTTRTLKHLEKMSKSKNVHLRRWSSEGSRPLLPWGAKAHVIEKDPMLTKSILENLKYDDEIYVRKSVANHLNDLSKKSPEYVLDLIDTWEKNAPKEQLEKIQWIKKFALRTLIKNGDPRALKKLHGKLTTKFECKNFKLSKKSYKLGEKLNFSLKLKNTDSKPHPFTIDYTIGYLNHLGKINYKTYKGVTVNLDAGEELEISKNHNLKKITTRVFYSGKHSLEIQINGVKSGKVFFDFKV